MSGQAFRAVVSTAADSRQVKTEKRHASHSVKKQVSAASSAWGLLVFCSALRTVELWPPGSAYCPAAAE